MTEPKSREGTMFGHYRLLRLIGKGGMGEVYEAEDTQKDRVVALKLLPESVSHDPVFRARLQREAHSAGRLQEPHVVPIHDYGEIDGVLFVDMRMINGSDLRKLLRDFGPMPPARAVAIVRQVASAIDAAHENGLVHRDVKPENILVTRDDFAYLVDFGIANAKSDEKLTELGTAVGTYAYMAPERFSGEEVTSRADVYALACVLYECLAGSQPYGGDSVSVVITGHLMQPIPRPSLQRPGIPPAFDQVIERGMAKKADERFATAGDLAAAATDALTPREQDQAATIVRRGEAAAAAPSGPTPTPTPDQGPTMAAPIPPPAYLPAYGAPQPPYPMAPQGPIGAPQGPIGAPQGPIGAPQGPIGAPPGYPPPPYGYPGGPPPPGTGPHPMGGKKTPWVPIVIVLAVLILTLGAVGTFVLTRSDSADSPTATTSTRASTARERPSTTRSTAPRTTDAGDPSGFDARLMALIPPSYPTSACEKAVPPAPGALATVDCRESAQPGGPAAARYSLFPNANSLNQQFQSAIAENEELLRCPGADADSPITWHYQATPDAVAGSVACGTYQGNADIVWTQDDDLLLADVQSADMDGLHDWWLNYS